MLLYMSLAKTEFYYITKTILILMLIYREDYLNAISKALQHKC